MSHTFSALKEHPPHPPTSTDYEYKIILVRVEDAAVEEIAFVMNKNTPGEGGLVLGVSGERRRERDEKESKTPSGISQNFYAMILMG
ncbi:hypothetical protein DMENIID0001_038600 [Sergentomyia squamirostris]